MIKKTIICLLLIAGIYSCGNDKKEKPATAMDTGREFIRASLDGDFPAAEQLILKDTQNEQLFSSYKTYYDRLPAEKKKHYKEASYEINKFLDVDSVTAIINYSNDYMNKPMDIKLVRDNKVWRVDFKYTYSGNFTN